MAGDIYRTIQPSQRHPQRQHINSEKKAFKLVHKHPELETSLLEYFNVSFSSIAPATNVDIASIVFQASLAINTALAR